MSFGKILKEKREEKNIKLETVSNAIKVKGDFLKAFEEENFDQMPKEPFATGFLKTYIDFLELKESEVYDLYLEFKKQIHTEELNKNLNHKKSKKNLNNDFTENIKIKLFELKNILRNNPKIKNINFLNIFFVILGVVVFLLLIVFIKTNAFVCNSKKSANVANPKISKDCKSVQKVENVTFYKKKY
jgi:cytoskeletal protein RodZ